MQDPKSWGVTYSQSIPHSNGWRCESSTGCDFFLPKGAGTWKNLVGIREGKLIFKCPVCFELFWVHLSREAFIEYAKKWSPDFPKNLKKSQASNL